MNLQSLMGWNLSDGRLPSLTWFSSLFLFCILDSQVSWLPFLNSPSKFRQSSPGVESDERSTVRRFISSRKVESFCTEWPPFSSSSTCSILLCESVKSSAIFWPTCVVEEIFFFSNREIKVLKPETHWQNSLRRKSRWKVRINWMNQSDRITKPR